jgi:hypothetical protein
MEVYVTQKTNMLIAMINLNQRKCSETAQTY